MSTETLYSLVSVDGTKLKIHVMDSTKSPEGYSYRCDRSLNLDSKRAFGTSKAHNAVKTVFLFYQCFPILI